MSEIIDFHTHCFPEAMADKAISSLEEKGGVKSLHRATPDALDKNHRQQGATGYCILPIATKPSSAASINKFSASISDPSRNIFAFGSIHPLDTEYKKTLAQVKELGLFGIKLHPEYQEFFVDQESLFPMYEEIFRLGLILVFHAGEDIGFKPPWHGEPHRIAKVAKTFKEGTIVAAHMGGFNCYEQALKELQPLPNVYIDTAFAANYMDHNVFSKLCHEFTADRILFATDSPWDSVSDTIALIEKTIGKANEKTNEKTDEKTQIANKEKIYYKNAFKLLRRVK